jgi:UDP-glucose-4-epimerase GalE
MRVLVTGGAGYIGSHAAKSLSRAGHLPITLDNLSQGNEEAVRWGPFVKGDIGDGALVKQTIERYSIDAVMHFAAHAYVGESVKDPRKYFNNNVSRTLRLLNAVLDTGIEKIVFSSTCATYGIPAMFPITEDMPQKPINPYGESKLMIERVLQAYGSAYGLKWMALRYFNAAGADPDGEVGEDHRPETHLIPRAVQAALGLRPTIKVFGGDYPTPDGTPIRDYIHVSDLARAHVLAIEYLESGGESMALNLATGQGHSVLQVIQTIEQIGGRTVPMGFEGRRPGDPSALVASADRARSVLSWEPRYPDLATIVRTAWDWQESMMCAGEETLIAARVG